MDFTLGLPSLLSAAAAGKALYALSPEDRHFLSRLFVSRPTTWCTSGSRATRSGISMQATAWPATPPASAPLARRCRSSWERWAELNGVRGSWGMAKGGMGTVTQALAAAAREHGAELRTDAPVAQVAVQGGRAVGVTLELGRGDPRAGRAEQRRPQAHLPEPGAPPGSLDAGFLREIEHYRMGSATFRINLALSATASPASRTRSTTRRCARSCTCCRTSRPTRRTTEVHRGQWSRDPYMVIQVASAIDPDLAPPGQHVMGAAVQVFSLSPLGRAELG